MYLLDTNHCSRLIQGHPVIIRRLAELGDQPVATCVIVRGELRFMADHSEQQASNLQLIEDFFADIYIFTIDNAVADTYGQLKADMLKHFGPKEKAQRRKARIEHFGIGDNDLWIAAIAKCYDLTVVSTDSDFERIKEATDLKLERWL